MVGSSEFALSAKNELVPKQTAASAGGERELAVGVTVDPVISTSAARVQATLNSNLGDAAFQELTTIGLVSPTGATMHLNVLGFIRKAPTTAGALGSVEIITHIGRVTLAGTSLTYFDDLPAALFKANGFDSVPAFAGAAAAGGTVGRRLLALELFGLFNAVLSASVLTPLVTAAGAEVLPPTLPANFMMLMRRRMPCVPIKLGANWTAPPDILRAVPVFNSTNVSAGNYSELEFNETETIVNYTTGGESFASGGARLGALPAGPGVDLCAYLAIPGEYLTNTTIGNVTESFITMGITVYRRGNTNIRTEYQHPLAPNVTLVEIIDNSDPAFPLEYRYQTYGPSKGVDFISPEKAKAAFNFTASGDIPALVGPLSYFRYNNVTKADVDAAAGITTFNVSSLLDSPFSYLGVVQLGGEDVRLWAFELAGGHMQVYWYDTVADRTVRRIHYGAFGDLDVLTIQDFPADPFSSHFLFAPPSADLVTMLDDSFPLVQKSTASNYTLPPRLTMDAFRPFVDTYVYSRDGDGAFTAARRAELLAQRRALVEPHTVPDHGRRAASVTGALSKLSCQPGNFCEARTSVGFSKGGPASTANSFTLPLGFVDITLGPVNKPPCMLEVGMGLPVSPIPFLCSCVARGGGHARSQRPYSPPLLNSHVGRHRRGDVQGLQGRPARAGDARDRSRPHRADSGSGRGAQAAEQGRPEPSRLPPRVCHRRVVHVRQFRAQPAVHGDEQR